MMNHKYITLNANKRIVMNTTHEPISFFPKEEQHDFMANMKYSNYRRIIVILADKQIKYVYVFWAE